MNLIKSPAIDLSQISRDELMELRRRRIRDRRRHEGSLICGRILGAQRSANDHIIELYPDLYIA